MADTVSVTQADRIAAIIRDYCKEGVRQEPFGGPLDTADLAARKILASTQPAPAFPREEVAEAIRQEKVEADKVYGVAWYNLEEISRVELILAALLQGKQP